MTEPRQVIHDPYVSQWPRDEAELDERDAQWKAYLAAIERTPLGTRDHESGSEST